MSFAVCPVMTTFGSAVCAAAPTMPSARAAADTNASVENIGARRLQTVMERLLDDVSYVAPDRSGETVVIDAAYVEAQVGALAKNVDLSKFIL